mgnify:CR=1 FL=1
MAIYLMDKTYRITNSGGTSAGRVVCAGMSTGQCTLPAAANAGKILGVTVTSQPELGRGISVRKAGIADVIAAGVIPAGAPLNIADATGRVKAVNEATGTKVQCLGFAETSSTQAGDVIEVFISIHERTT